MKAGFVALLGRPNVGKSTLVNALLGEKVAIVSPKPQTTRTRIHGILNLPDAQVILVDTPGLVESTTALKKAMRRVTGHAASDSDVRLVVAECRGATVELSDADMDVLKTATQSQGPVVLALNKIDTLPQKELLLPWMARYQQELSLAAIVPISAKRKEGLDVLLDELIKLLPESPALFPQDLYTDQAERVLCAELVREQLLMALREEVPHGALVVIESFEDERDDVGPKRRGLCRLEGRIYVERDSQKGIVVGKGGSMIRTISEKGRLAIEELLGCKVFLRLTVHVAKDWTASAAAVRRFGFGTEKDE